MTKDINDIIIRMSKNANSGRLNLKKRVVQIRFNASCIPYRPATKQKGRQFLLLSNRYAEMAIMQYNTVHTGPNTHLGGVSIGFLSDAYQSMSTYTHRHRYKNQTY